MATRTWRMRALWPIMLVPLGLSLAVLFAGMSARLFPGQAEDDDLLPAAADVSRVGDDAVVRERALLALAKLALATLPPADPDEQIAAVPDDATGPAAPGALGALFVPDDGNAADAANVAESRAIAEAAYAEVERLIAEQAKAAHVVIAVDEAMQVGLDYTASLMIEGGPGKDIMPLMQQTAEPVAVELSVEIAPDAEAYASSSQFSIASITPARQAIRALAPTVWQWTLTPRRDGKATLMIILRQNVTIGGQTFSFPVKQFPQVIRVDLSWWLWLRELTRSFWGLVTTLLVAGASGATIYSALRNRGGKDAGGRSGRKPARKAA